MNKKDLELANYLNKISEKSFEDQKILKIEDKRSFNYSHDFKNWDQELELLKAYHIGYQNGIRKVITFLSYDLRSYSNENRNYNQFGKYLRSKGWEI